MVELDLVCLSAQRLTKIIAKFTFFKKNMIYMVYIWR